MISHESSRSMVSLRDIESLRTAIVTKVSMTKAGTAKDVIERRNNSRARVAFRHKAVASERVSQQRNAERVDDAGDLHPPQPAAAASLAELQAGNCSSNRGA